MDHQLDALPLATRNASGGRRIEAVSPKAPVGGNLHLRPVGVKRPDAGRRILAVLADPVNKDQQPIVAGGPGSGVRVGPAQGRVVTAQLDEVMLVGVVGRELGVEAEEREIHAAKARVQVAPGVLAQRAGHLKRPFSRAGVGNVVAEGQNGAVLVADFLPSPAQVADRPFFEVFGKQHGRIAVDPRVARISRRQPGSARCRGSLLRLGRIGGKRPPAQECQSGSSRQSPGHVSADSHRNPPGFPLHRVLAFVAATAPP